MMNDEEEKVPSKPKKQTGPYNNDPPKEFEQESWDAIKVMLGLNDDSLKKKILILGGKDETYDCFKPRPIIYIMYVLALTITHKGIRALTRSPMIATVRGLLASKAIYALSYSLNQKGVLL